METHGITVRSTRVLRGPNLYAHMPVIQAVLDIGPYEERPSNAFPGFVERISAWLPGLHKHECSVGRPLGEQAGAIVEVNAAPGLRMHLHPAEGQARDVASPIVEMLYPKDVPSRIPIIAVTEQADRRGRAK
jgi:hypothetical protein